MRVIPLLLAALLPVALVAQTPDPARTGSLRDSLTHITDAAALETLLAESRDVRTTAITARETRRGWILLRLGQLGTGRARLDEAIRAFDEAIYRDGRNVEAWVGLARAKILLAERGAVVKASMHQRLGEYYEDAAAAHLARAIRLDPRNREAVALLAERLDRVDVPLLDEPIAEALELAARHPANGPMPQLLLARHLRAAGRHEAAAAAVERALALGASQGVGLLEWARSLYRAGLADSAVRTYLAGASQADSLARSAYRRDIAWVASPEELAAFDATRPDSVGAWIAHFWMKRDAAAVRPVGDRLKEHLRRWFYVQEHFRLTGRMKGSRFVFGGYDPTAIDEGVLEPFGVSPGTLPEFDGRELGVDHRGAIYMRHGEPVDRAMSVHPQADIEGCAAANETWRYLLPEGPILLHFCASLRMGAVAPTTLVAMLPFDPQILGARAGLDTRYARAEMELLSVATRNRQDRRVEQGGGASRTIARINPVVFRPIARHNAVSLKLGLTTDTHVLSYETDLEPTVVVYGVGDGGPAGRALVVFALPGERLRPVERDGRLVYPVQVRVTAVDTAAKLSRTIDTLRLFAVGDTLREGAHLYGVAELPLPAGSYSVRTLLAQPERSAGGAAGRAAVPVPGPGALAMSDLITGDASSGLVWRHRGREIPLNPLDAYRSGAAVELFYELTGTTPGAEYRTDIELARVGGRGEGRGKDRTAFRFTERADGATLTMQRSLGLAELQPGRYLLTLTVRGPQGASITRERMINVVDAR